MTHKQIRFDNPFESSEKFQETIDGTGLKYDSICYDSDGTITMIINEPIEKLKTLKQTFGLKMKNNVNRVIRKDTNYNELVDEKIKPNDLS